MARPYRNRRDRRKPSEGKPYLPEIAILGAEIAVVNVGLGTCTVTLDAQCIAGGPLVCWRLKTDGTVQVITTGTLNSAGTVISFDFPSAFVVGEWLLFPGNQPTIRGGANWLVGMAVLPIEGA